MRQEVAGLHGEAVENENKRGLKIYNELGAVAGGLEKRLNNDTIYQQTRRRAVVLLKFSLEQKWVLHTHTQKTGEIGPKKLKQRHKGCSTSGVISHFKARSVSL